MDFVHNVLFDEADALYDENAKEPATDEVFPTRPRRKKSKGQRETDLKEFPQDIVPTYAVSKETLDAFYGPGCWKHMPDETYKRLRHEPGFWMVEVHTVEVCVNIFRQTMSNLRNRPCVSGRCSRLQIHLQHILMRYKKAG